MRENELNLRNVSSTSCLQAADNLRELDGGNGQVFYVAEPAEIGRVMHAYYVPSSGNDTDFALNHVDNGFPQFPKLTVKQVKEMGFPIPPNISSVELHRLIQENW